MLTNHVYLNHDEQRRAIQTVQKTVNIMNVMNLMTLTFDD